jgi:hypothetical protein
MIYDSASREVVLFGGYDGSYLNDTWAWNGTGWTELHRLCRAACGSRAAADRPSWTYGGSISHREAARGDAIAG